MARTKQEALLQSYERISEVPLTVLALAMIPALVAPSVFSLSLSAQLLVEAFDWFVWAIFAADLGVRLYLAPRRLTYLRQHWLDAVIVALPFLRPFRALRSLRLIRVALFGGRFVIGLRRALVHHGLQYVLLVGLIVMFGAATVVYAFEANGGGSIRTPLDALWWAIVTVTTVGYGDYIPVTPEGRTVAVVLMVFGIAVFSTVTAIIASFLVQSDQRDPASEQLRDIADRLSNMEALLARQDASAKVETEVLPEALR